MLRNRIMYFGLIDRAKSVRSLMDKLPDNFTEVNMLLVSPTVGDSKSVDISPYELHEGLNHQNICIPKKAKRFGGEKGSFREFMYKKGVYRIFTKSARANNFH